MTFHIIIQQERRVPLITEHGEDRSRLAHAISAAVPTGNTIQGPMGVMPEYVAGPAQLHSHTPTHPVRWVTVMVPNPAERPEDWDEEIDGIWPAEIDAGHYENDISDPQFVGVFEWDGRAPYVIAHKGDYSAVTMRYAGWPDMTKEQYDALPAADTPA